MRERWESKINFPKDPDSRFMPDNDCLAIARYVICAYHFPSCTDKDEVETPVCDWVCELFKRRCPNERTLQDKLCSLSSERKTCSSAKESLTVFTFGVLSLTLLALY